MGIKYGGENTKWLNRKRKIYGGGDFNPRNRPKSSSINCRFAPDYEVSPCFAIFFWLLVG